MKFVRFTLRDKSEYTFPMDKAGRILDSQQQLVKITEENGEWDGTSINKADVVKTERDFKAERDWKYENTLKLEEAEAELTPEDRLKRDELIKKTRADLEAIGVLGSTSETIPT